MAVDKPKVIVMGGGVAGLSAAHELLQRGYRVTVLERQGVPGGKARSYYWTQPGSDWSRGLPAEHGFRFFPGFYRHVTDTLKRIPDFASGHTVFQNLVAARDLALARYHLPPLTLATRLPRSLAELKRTVRAVVNGHVHISSADYTRYNQRLWQVMTSCPARRLGQYEKLSWWDFTVPPGEPDDSDYVRYLVNLTRTLVAADPRKASTRTNGDILGQMIQDAVRPRAGSDRVLNGPTNEVWIHPWIAHLLTLGGERFEYWLDAEVTALQCEGGRITGITVAADPAGRITACDRYGPTVQRGGLPGEVSGDYYLAAVPVERMAGLLTDSLTRADPNLASLRELVQSLEWMNGIQFYLRRDVPVVPGHTIYTDPRWALTSISQHQFWTGVNLSGYGDGQVRGILSVDISNWSESGLWDHSPEQVKGLVWEGVKASLATSADPLRDADLLYTVLDPDIEERLRRGAGPPSKQELTNLEPLLVNRTGTWDLRPESFTRLPNLFLAADYVRTNTDLATMEGANEAARRAVNGILDRCGERDYCRVWPLYEPWLLAPLRWRDRRRYALGLDWRDPAPWLFRAWMGLQKLLVRLFGPGRS